MGLLSVGGYYVEVGYGPRIISVKRVESLEELIRIMSSSQFRDLVCELKEYVTGYREQDPAADRPHARRALRDPEGRLEVQPVLRPSPGEDGPSTHASSWTSTCPCSRASTTGGHRWVERPDRRGSEIISELTFKDPVDIGALFDNASYRELTHVLKRPVRDQLQQPNPADDRAIRRTPVVCALGGNDGIGVSSTQVAESTRHRPHLHQPARRAHHPGHRRLGEAATRTTTSSAPTTRRARLTRRASCGSTTGCTTRSRTTRST